MTNKEKHKSTYVEKIFPDADRMIPLNRSELVYLASEGVVGSICQVYGMRFREAHTQDELRVAVRHLVHIYPRMRSMIRPTFFSHRLRLLSEDGRIDTLFEKAFQVIHGAGADNVSLQKYMEELANRPFELENELPIRIRLLVGNPVPILVLAVHHIVCDGRGMIQMIGSIMAYLNGVKHPELQVDEPTMLPAVLPASFMKRIQSLVRSYSINRAEILALKQVRTIELGKPGPTFGSAGVSIHIPPFNIQDIKRSAADRGYSVTELLVAVLAAGFARNVEQDGLNAVTVRFSVDLRPYFPEDRRPVYGNYVASFVMHLKRWNDMDATVADIRAELRKNLQMFERKEMSYPLVMGEIQSRVGIKILRKAALAMKRRGLLPKATFHYTTVGSINMLNSHGARAQVDEVTGCVPALVPLIGTSWIGDKQMITCSYPRHEIDEAAMDRVFADFEASLGNMLKMDAAQVSK